MSKIKEIIVEAVLPVIKAVAKTEMELALSIIRDNNTAETYQNTLEGLYSNFSLLKEAALKTKAHIDDGIVDLVLEAVKGSAEERGIVLL